MMTYGFKDRFADALLMDTKLSTIRAPRKDGRLPKPGEVIRRYTGMRTKNCRWRGDRICKSVRKVKIKRFQSTCALYIDGRGAGDVNEIARKEGFRSWGEMADFFATVHTLPFTGWLIEWHPYSANEK